MDQGLYLGYDPDPERPGTEGSGTTTGLGETRARERATKEKGCYSPFIWYLAQSAGKPDAERGLHNGRGDGNAVDGAKRPDQVDG